MFELKNAKKHRVGDQGAFRWGEFVVIVTIDDGSWHLSISHALRYPTYEEIKAARYKFVPDEVTMAMLFPSKREFVNVHPNCFHLWEIKDKPKLIL